MVIHKYLRRHFIENSLALANIQGKVLEIGSGQKWRYIKGSITLNRDKSAQSDIIVDAESLPFTEEEFKTILCLEALEHTAYPQKMINEIYLVFKKGGKVILTVPFSKST